MLVATGLISLLSMALAQQAPLFCERLEGAAAVAVARKGSRIVALYPWLRVNRGRQGMLGTSVTAYRLVSLALDDGERDAVLGVFDTWVHVGHASHSVAVHPERLSIFGVTARQGDLALWRVPRRDDSPAGCEDLAYTSAHWLKPFKPFGGVWGVRGSWAEAKPYPLAVAALGSTYMVSNHTSSPYGPRGRGMLLVFQEGPGNWSWVSARDLGVSVPTRHYVWRPASVRKPMQSPLRIGEHAHLEPGGTITATDTFVEPGRSAGDAGTLVLVQYRRPRSGPYRRSSTSWTLPWEGAPAATTTVVGGASGALLVSGRTANNRTQLWTGRLKADGGLDAGYRLTLSPPRSKQTCRGMAIAGIGFPTMGIGETQVDVLLAVGGAVGESGSCAPLLIVGNTATGAFRVLDSPLARRLGSWPPTSPPFGWHPGTPKPKALRSRARDLGKLLPAPAWLPRKKR